MRSENELFDFDTLGQQVAARGMAKSFLTSRKSADVGSSFAWDDSAGCSDIGPQPPVSWRPNAGIDLPELMQRQRSPVADMYSKDGSGGGGTDNIALGELVRAFEQRKVSDFVAAMKRLQDSTDKERLKRVNEQIDEALKPFLLREESAQYFLDEALQRLYCPSSYSVVKVGSACEYWDTGASTAIFDPVLLDGGLQVLGAGGDLFRALGKAELFQVRSPQEGSFVVTKASNADDNKIIMTA